MPMWHNTPVDFHKGRHILRPKIKIGLFDVGYRSNEKPVAGVFLGGI